ncbi:Cyclin-A1-1 [Ananas comosus]|uniref:Cyclin-A1-1 n=1 Tax=Ananas comosus TaxID=4615 RepID=A0A199VUU2_ANACO|nr:Cyclin-A1-1 [Ananas comosus]
MASSNRRSTPLPGPGSSSSSLAKRPAAAENAAKVAAPAAEQAKKRVALGNITNQCNVGRGAPRIAGSAKGTNKVNVTSSASTVKKSSIANIPYTSSRRSSLTSSSSLKPTSTLPTKDPLLPKNDGPLSTVGSCLAPCSNVASPGRSGDSASLDETMSTCDSMKSPDFEYIDNGDSSMVASLERRANNNLHISDHDNAAEIKWKRNVPAAMETDAIFDADNNYEDPQMCATLACDIYKHLRVAETKKRPSTDFMERIQTDINASMRAILIDWLVEVAEEYRLVPDTLYLTVNYVDRYLSGNEMNRQRLQLLGVSCMLIAAKYEEICAPQVEEFCYITDNTYFKDEVPMLQLEFLTNYVAELSLLEYNLLCYSPSLIAASSIFLARFILQPAKKPWNMTLHHYTLYKPSELCDCAKALHRLFCNSPGSNLPAIREKYSQHKYKFVAKKYCPTSIPSEFFQDFIN